MLRKFVLALGGAVIAGSLAALLFGYRGGAIALFVWSCFVVLAIVYERVRYKPILDAPPAGEGWLRTAERFVDTGCGKTVTVYSRAKTGERAYVADNLTASGQTQ